MILDSTLRKLQAVLAGAVSANQPESIVDFVVWNVKGEASKQGTYPIALNSNADVTILPAPTTAGEVREITRVSIYNKDTASVTLTVKTDDGTTEFILHKETLLTLESIHFEKGRGWYCLDANGNIKEVTASTFSSLTVTGNETVGGTLGVTGITTLTGALVVDSTTDSTAITNGSIQTDGGLGVTKAIWVGGLANIAGAVTLQNTLAVTGVSTLARIAATAAAASQHTLSAAYTDDVALIVTNSQATRPYGMNIVFSAAAPDDNTDWFLRCVDNVAARCYIFSDGDLQNSDNSYGAISDERLKQDIVPAGSQWADVKALGNAAIKWRDIGDVKQYGDDAKIMLGLGAQTVEKISPWLVIETPETEEYDAPVLDDKTGEPLIGMSERKTRRTGRMIKGVQYSLAYMKMLVAFAEAQARIEALEAK